MAHADPLSLPQAREKLERAIREFARCTLAAARYSGVISAYNPRDTDNLRAAEKAVDRAIDDLLVAASKDALKQLLIDYDASAIKEMQSRGAYEWFWVDEIEKRVGIQLHAILASEIPERSS